MEHKSWDSSAGEGTYKVLVAFSGSVAALKAPLIVKKLAEQAQKPITLIGITTNSAKHFYDQAEVEGLVYALFTDEDEWTLYQDRGDPVLHIEVIESEMIG